MPPKRAAAAEENGATGAENGSVLKINDKIPSEGDHRFFIAIISNLISKPDVNWEGVAKTMGLKDVKCSKERWRQITKKFDLELQDAPAPAGTPAGTPATKGRGRKPATAKTEAASPDATGDGPVPATPKPKATRGRKTPAKSADVAVSDDEQDKAAENPGDGSPTTPLEQAAATSSKVTRGRGASGKKRASPTVDEEGDAEEGTPAKKKPTPRKPRGPNKKTLAKAAAAEAAAAEAAAAAGTTGAESEQTNGDASTTNADIEMKEAHDEVNNDVQDKAKADETDSSLSPAPPSTADAGEA